MSTKIYSGFKIETTDIFTIKGMVDSIVPMITEQQVGAFRQWCKRQLRQDPGIKPLALSDKFWQITQERRGRLFVERDLRVDFDFDIVFIPSKRATYGMTFVEWPDWHALWMAVPGVFDYSYWNNTDQTPGISDFAWAMRGRRWEKLLPGNTTPAQAGFTFRVGELDVLKTMETAYEEVEHAKAAEAKAQSGSQGAA